MNNTKIQVRATNLAREGMEMMFNIRDTNRRKCSGLKDKFWLYLGSGVDASQEEKCDVRNGTTDYIFQKGIYALKEGKNGSGDTFIYAETLADVDEDKFYDLEGFFDDDEAYSKARSGAMIIFTGTYAYLSGNVPQVGDISDLLGDGVEFYRIARVYGIYDKTATTPDMEATELTNSSPKEMRFCVKVFYRNLATPHSTELCSIMTNFME